MSPIQHYRPRDASSEEVAGLLGEQLRARLAPEVVQEMERRLAGMATEEVRTLDGLLRNGWRGGLVMMTGAPLDDVDADTDTIEMTVYIPGMPRGGDFHVDVPKTLVQQDDPLSRMSRPIRPDQE